MNVLVTGGCGFIGSHCVIQLQLAGHNVVVVDNLVNSDKSVVIKIAQITGIVPSFRCCDIRNYEELSDIFDTYAIDAVFHFAAHKAVGESVIDPLKYYDNNIGGLLTLLKCMGEHDVSKLIFSSSATVYGAPSSLPLTEESPTRAINPYGRTKLFSEDILRDMSDAGLLKVVSLRYFNPVGCHPSGLIGENPKCAPTNLFPVIMSVYNTDKALQVFGNDYDTIDGSPVRDYIHVMDLAQGHVDALRYLGQTDKQFTVFNLGTGEGYSVLQIIKSFETLSGKKLPYIIQGRRQGDAPSVYTSCNLAKELLLWEAKLSKDDMIKDTLAYHSM